MDRFNSATLPVGNSDFASESEFANGSSTDFLLAASVNSEWILEKVGTQFDADVMQNLKKAVYAIGQGGRRWFSGGGEVSEREASTLLDYLVLVELLLDCRDDLTAYGGDLTDCREQLALQVDRCTEGQPERVVAHVNDLVERFKLRLAADNRVRKAR